MLNDPLAIIAVLVSVVCVSRHLADRYMWARRVSVIILIIFGSALCSNLGLIPSEDPIYGSIIGFAVPIAVCVILFTVSLPDVLIAGRPMIVAFVLASIATVVGVLAANLVLQVPLSESLGVNSWRIAGPYTGTYIGGSLNFVSLWQGMGIDDPDLFAAANAVDNLTLIPLFALWTLVPNWLTGKWKVSDFWKVESEPPVAQTDREEQFDLTHVVTLVALAVVVTAVSEWVSTRFIEPMLPGFPGILVVTTIALVLAQVGPIRRLAGARELGDLAFYIFFAAIGAMINFVQAVQMSPILFVYVAVVMVVHFVVLYGMGWLFRMDVAVLTIASVATKGGPALVPPLAESKDWRHLILPGIIIAMMGYAVGNYVGFGVAHAVRMLVGGQ